MSVIPKPESTAISLGVPSPQTTEIPFGGSGTITMPTPGSYSGGEHTALEQQARVEREELVSDALRLRWLSIVGACCWIAFILDDWLIAQFIHPVNLRYFLAIRLIGLGPILYVAYRLNVRKPLTRRSLTLHDIGVFSVVQSGLAFMSLKYDGIASPLLSGMLVALIARSSVLASPWRRGLLTLGVPLLSFPMIMGISSAFLPEIQAQFLAPHDRAVFLRHLFVLAASLAVCVWGGHGNWALRRQLFESRNIGKYRLKRRIGRGGMGEVWVAYHAGLQRDVALKVLRPDHETDPIAVQRFEQEVAATSRLTHPNTVRIFDYGVTEDGIWYYAMELLEGVTLFELVRNEGALPIQRALPIAHQIARALAEAHARGIVHRDVKPENIFITRAGDEPDFAKILDFGIAKVYGDARGVTLTRTGAVFGTPAYISPEAARGQITSSRSDVYGLGAVLYYVLAGHPPFVSQNPTDVLMAHVSCPPPPLSAITTVAIPPDIDQFVLRCLEKAPEQRFADASEAAIQLSALVARYCHTVAA